VVSHANFVGWVECNVTYQPPLMGIAIAQPILQNLCDRHSERSEESAVYGVLNEYRA